MGERLIIWKEQPLEYIRQIANYLIEEFSASAADKFLDKVSNKVDRIAAYPESGQITRFKNVRRLKVDKYHSIYYRSQGNKIFIIFMWDGRQNPQKNPYE